MLTETWRICTLKYRSSTVSTFQVVTAENAFPQHVCSAVEPIAGR
jgi:hypothetical protein